MLLRLFQVVLFLIAADPWTSNWSGAIRGLAAAACFWLIVYEARRDREHG